MDREYEEPELEYEGDREYDNEHSEQQEGEEIEAPDEGELPPQDEEPGEEGEAEQPVAKKPKKQKTNIGERLSQVVREKYRAQDEARQLREENERLRQMAETSTKTALDHYEQAVQQRLAAAKDQKIKAFESGDISAQADADAAYTDARIEASELNRMKVQHQPRPEQSQQQYYDPQQDLRQKEEYVRDWAMENTWFNPSSEDYDEDMSREVNAYCTQFDNNIYRAGLGHLINTPEYLQEVNKHIHALRQNGAHLANRGRDLPMRQTRSGVAPVRSGAYGQQQRAGQQQTKLTTEEKEIARRLGVDEKAYLQQRIKDEQDHPNRRRGYR